MHWAFNFNLLAGAARTFAKERQQTSQASYV